MKEKPDSGGRLLFRLLRAAVLIYVVLLLLLAGCQRRMIYYPSKASEPALRVRADKAGLAPWVDGEGRVIGWSCPRAETRPANRLVIFHGNAGFALHRTYFRDGFRSVDQGQVWEVSILEYPGYGARPGSPSEEAFAEAARRALKELTASDSRPVFLLGESVGAGVACSLAGEFPDQIAGVVLITPFTTLVEVAAYHYRVFPVRLLLREKYDNRAALAKYRGPVAFLLAGQDEIVPAKFGRQLYDEYAGPKQLWVQEGATHNTVDYRPEAAWWKEITEFLLKNQE